MRASDCGVLFSSWFLLIRGLNLARRQAETPLIALCKNPGPLLASLGVGSFWKVKRGVPRTVGK
jgi:hypothetical protein